MTLRQKTFMVVGSALIGLLLMLLVVSYQILLKGFYDLETQSVENNITRLVNVLTDELYSLYVEAGDYSAWDDTYRYMIDHNEPFVTSNLSNSTFLNLNLNLIIILNKTGKMVFGKIYDSETAELQLLPTRFQNQFEHNKLFTYNETNQGQVSGFLLLEGQLILVACRPILSSEGLGPSRGTLLMGRILDQAEIKRFSRLTNLSLQVRLLNHQPLLDDFVSARQQLLNTRSVIQILSENQIAGYVLLKDIYQQPVALVRIDLPRKIYHQGLISLRSLSLVVLILALGFAVLILWLFERLVLARLAILSEEVRHIRTTEDYLTVTVVGQDELAHLAITINEMLHSLQASHARLRRSEASLAEAQRIAHVGNWEWDITNDHFGCSDEIYRIFGLPPQSCAPELETFLSYVHPADRHLVNNAIQQAMSQLQSINLEHRIVNPQSNERFIHLQGEFWQNNRGEIISFIGTLQDITERKLAQAETLRLLEENRFLIYRSLAIQEEERRHLARELHDEFGQCITAIQADTEAILELAQQSRKMNDLMNGLGRLERIEVSANAILSVSTHIYDVVHTLMRQLRPSGLDELGLVEILQELLKNWQLRHSEIKCQCTTKGELDQLGEAINITIYRVMQECLTNIAKYANASMVSIHLATDSPPQFLIFSVQDNGDGIPSNLSPEQRENKGGLGLIGIRERVQALDGTLRIDSAPGQGVKIILTIPISEEYQQKRRKWQ